MVAELEGLNRLGACFSKIVIFGWDKLRQKKCKLN